MSGGVDGEVLTQGWHLVSPTKKVTTYSIGLEQSYLTSEDKGDSPNDESFNVPTSDGKTVKVNLEFSYRFDEDRVAETFTVRMAKPLRIPSLSLRLQHGLRKLQLTIL